MQDRYGRGLELLQQVDGDGGVQVIDSLKGIAPDVGRYIVEFAFGTVYAEGSLSMRDRELATIASLCTQGACGPQLKVHIRGALNCGADRARGNRGDHATHSIRRFPQGAKRNLCGKGRICINCVLDPNTRAEKPLRQIGAVALNWGFFSKPKNSLFHR